MSKGLTGQGCEQETGEGMSSLKSINELEEVGIQEV